MRVPIPLPALASMLAVGTFMRPAHSNPRPLPFTYQHEQLAEGASELEEFADITPVRALSASTGEPVWYGLTEFQTEFEHGITNRLELGLYVTLVPAGAPGFAEVPRAMEGNGMKQRLRWKLAETGEWPIDAALYGELVENEREIETEAKIILQRRFGLMRAILNLAGEREYYYDGKHDIVVNPSGGLTFEITPSVQPGIEWWMRAEFPEENRPSPRPFALGPHQYVGPAVLLQFGELWWTTGIYIRVSDFGHTLAAGEGFGNVWARTVVGIGL